MLKKIINYFRSKDIYYYSALITIISLPTFVYVFTYNICDNIFEKNEKTLTIIDSLIFELKQDGGYALNILKNKEGYMLGNDVPIQIPTTDIIDQAIIEGEIRLYNLKMNLTTIRHDLHAMISELNRATQAQLLNKPAHVQEAMINVIILSDDIYEMTPKVLQSLEQYQNEIINNPVYCKIHPESRNYLK